MILFISYQFATHRFSAMIERAPPGLISLAAVVSSVVRRNETGRTQLCLLNGKFLLNSIWRQHENSYFYMTGICA